MVVIRRQCEALSMVQFVVLNSITTRIKTRFNKSMATWQSSVK